MTALSCAKSLSLLFSSVETFLVSLEYKANISKRKRKEREKKEILLYQRFTQFIFSNKKKEKRIDILYDLCSLIVSFHNIY